MEKYIGEHLLPGQLGHFFIILSLVASLVATIAYFMEVRTTRSLPGSASSPWRTLARGAFLVETISVISIFAILFYIIHNHLFEYYYAWKHSSRSLEFKYLLACFWEGQEGSFLLWSFWHCILGLVVIRTGKSWEAPVMTIISVAQFALATMVLGIYFFGSKIGTNPFVLLRETTSFLSDASIHINGDLSQPVRPDYMTFVKDGNDLNPLLQNKWMVIHPPVLFLGFASTLIPFAFALAGLWTRRRADWVNQALPWALFSLAVFGVGIMMGAWWAYESLNFGGYWAWDPVENASLVPWLILAAGIHTMLIYKHSGYSLRSTYLFLVLTFIFVLYSTFLTRSGILGESSVHAFTDLGMNVQLFLFLYGFVWLAPVMAANTYNKRIITIFSAAVLGLACYYLGISWLPLVAMLAGIITFLVFVFQQVPSQKKEEEGSSREFWMFIGSLVFFLSAMVIIFKTSLPVFNKLFGTNTAAPEDVEYSYNQIQVLVAVIIGLLTGATQYFRYRQTPAGVFWRKMAVPLIISVVAAALVLIFGKVNYTQKGLGFQMEIWLAVAASIYAIVANAGYIWIGMRGKLKLSGGSIAHLGFGMVLLGILLSSAKKEVLSFNTSGIAIPFGKDSDQKPGENLTLVKGIAMKMGKYDVTYTGDSLHPKKETQRFFRINFHQRETGEEFTLWPNAFVNYKDNMGLMSSPDARHYPTHDIFAYVSSMPDPGKNADTTKFINHVRAAGDTIFYSKGYIIVENFAGTNNIPMDKLNPEDSAFTASLRIHSFARQGDYKSNLLLIKPHDKPAYAEPDTVMAESLILQLEDLRDGKAHIGVRESSNVLEYVTLKAYKFPYIGILWTGIVITALGTFISMGRRIQLNRAARGRSSGNPVS